MTISPFVTTYAGTIPYITLTEFKTAPTALDIVDLYPGGNQSQQDQVLTDTIYRASSWVDTICRQIVGATLDIEKSRYRIDRNGYIKMPLRFKPVLEIKTVSLGRLPSQMVALTDFSDVVLNKYSVEIPAFAAASPIINSGFNPGGGWNIGDKIITQVSYVNGWVNAITTGAIAQGANSIPVNSAMGIYPGSQLTIFDGVSTELVTVAANYVVGSLNVGIVGVTAFAHATVGTSVSNLPRTVKEATILLTTVLIQTRGNDAIILESMENPMRTSTAYGAMGQNIEMAKEMLATFMRTW